MEKKAFAQDTRYTVTLRDENGKWRPASLYVYRLYDTFMVARMTQNDGLLRKLKYDDIIKVVKTRQVSAEDRFVMPEAVLAEKTWQDRDKMFRYSTSPHMGK